MPPSRTSSPNQPSQRKKKHSNVKSLIVLAGLTAVILLLVFVLSSNAKTPVISALPTSQATVITQSVAEKKAFTPPVVGPYDEKDPPQLINPNNMLPEGYQPPLADIGGGHSMHINAAEPFKAMQAAAQKDGITLVPISGYRTHDHQVRNYNNSIQRYLDQGYSKEESIRLTRQYYALPGASEHEAGLAIDVNSLETSFEDTPAFTWLQENCIKFGFILRYEKDTTEITTINYEPWHYRYVGTNHAKAISDLGITLEEYVPLLLPVQGNVASSAV